MFFVGGRLLPYLYLLSHWPLQHRCHLLLEIFDFNDARTAVACAPRLSSIKLPLHPSDDSRSPSIHPLHQSYRLPQMSRSPASRTVSLPSIHELLPGMSSSYPSM